MIWSLYWYAMAVWRLWDYSQQHEIEALAFAVIFVVIGTGQRVVSKIEKVKK